MLLVLRCRDWDDDLIVLYLKFTKMGNKICSMGRLLGSKLIRRCLAWSTQEISKERIVSLS